MKIAIVFDNMVYGGIERVGISYVKILQSLGYKVDAYVLNPNTEDIINELEELCRVKVIRFPKLICSEYYWNGAKRWKWGRYPFSIISLILTILTPFLRIFKGVRKQYDISIAFSGHINDLTFVANNFVKANKKVAWLHGALYGYYLISPGFEFLYRKIHNLVTLSDMCNIDCKRIEKWNEKNIVKIYNPMLLNRKKVDNEKVLMLNKKYGDYLLMVGRIAPDKDHITVVKCMKYLKEVYGHQNKMLFVGDGVLRKEVEELVKTEGLEDTVFFEGVCKDVENYYSGAKLFVHSSPLEGLPTVLLEAMTFGLPIVATDSMPGVKEILGNSEYGEICDVGDHIGMAQKIDVFLEDAVIYQKYKNMGYQRIEDFQPEVISKQIDMFLNSI